MLAHRNREGLGEMVQIVDRDNRPVGQAHRARMRQERLVHRAVYILVFDSRGQLFVHRRTASKDIYPSYLDLTAGGVVLAGEDYLDAARRELQEELGISGTELHEQFDLYHEDEENRVWGRVYTCVWDGPLILQEEEIEQGWFIAPKQVIEMAGKEKFCPDGIAILERLLAKGIVLPEGG